MFKGSVWPPVNKSDHNSRTDCLITFLQIHAALEDSGDRLQLLAAVLTGRDYSKTRCFDLKFFPEPWVMKPPT